MNILSNLWKIVTSVVIGFLLLFSLKLKSDKDKAEYEKNVAVNEKNELLINMHKDKADQEANTKVIEGKSKLSAQAKRNFINDSTSNVTESIKKDVKGVKNGETITVSL